MLSRTIFFFIISFLAYSENNFKDLSLDEFKQLLDSSNNKRAFYKEYLSYLEEADGDVNAVIALYSDQDLYKNYVYSRRSAWRGVPIVIKDNIDSVGLANTAGSLAMLDNFPKDDAHIVKLLKNSGFVLAGKANLSEWANFRGNPSTSGWSSYGGQTNNPYDLSFNPCGSSSGSAAVVAEGLVPVAIGTETNGSISCPASINGIVGIKPTVGLVSRDGIIPISETQDTAGPMARSVSDAAAVLHAISGTDPKDPATKEIPKNYDFEALLSMSKQSLLGKRIGLIFPEEVSDYEKVLLEKSEAILSKLGAEVLRVNFDIQSNYKWDNEYYVLLYEFREGVNKYLESSASGMNSLSDLIAFNEENSESVLKHFGHEIFLDSVSATDEDKYQKGVELIVSRAQSQIDGLLVRDSLDGLVGLTRNPAWKTDHENGDSRGFNGLSWGNGGLSAVAGYPHITIPLDYVEGLPVGLSFFASAWEEAKIINFAYAFEQENSFFPRPNRDKK
ncbi:MAG: amidase family protein [Proteobacteria bacterium]|nr:amidase family protein [Pseudomonadota bacterium]MDA1056366.1 amidase family protein [Pseudomonadota bacterium]